MDYSVIQLTKNFLCLSCIALSAAAQASDLELDALTCGSIYKASASSRANEVWKSIKLIAKRKVDGDLTIDGPVTSGDACVKNVTVGAAFGVLSVVGEVCSGEVEALRRFVLLKAPDLQAISTGQVAGTLWAYKAGNRSIALFAGAPTQPLTSDPKSSRFSYVCTLTGAGPQ